MRQLIEGGGFNTLVGEFKSLTDVNVWMQVNLPSDAPKFDHFVDLYILLAGIRKTGVSSEEVQNKEVHAKRVKRSEKQSVVVTSFQMTFPEDWGLSNENNHFSNMTTFEQWNNGDGQRVILTSIKKGIIFHEKAALSSFYYAFTHHQQARLLCKDMLTKNNLLREMATVVEDLYHRLCLKCFGS